MLSGRPVPDACHEDTKGPASALESIWPSRFHWGEAVGPHPWLGSPVVPFTLFFGSGFPYRVIGTNQKKGALVIIWSLIE